MTRRGAEHRTPAGRPAGDVVADPGRAAGASGTPFPRSFYDRDPRVVARDLLGASLSCRTPEGVATGTIVETEAYLGHDDPACHAMAGRTRRTWNLFGPPGIAYVYRIYGMHWCFNAVTLAEGVGSAVLVRALVPRDGLALMRRRRPRAAFDRDLTNGPGKLCAALGIDGRLDGEPLDGDTVSLAPGAVLADDRVIVTPRIGITRGAALPYRYLVRDEPHVSATPRRFPRADYAR